MSIASFKTFLVRAAADPSQAPAVQEALSTPERLTAYAQAQGYALQPEEVEALLAQAHAVSPDDAQALSDESLDHVSGAGPRKAHFS